MIVDGWKYYSGRVYHYAYHFEHERRTINHTRRQNMSAEAFRAHVLLGFPPNRLFVDQNGTPGAGNWNNESIIAELARQESMK